MDNISLYRWTDGTHPRFIWSAEDSLKGTGAESVFTNEVKSAFKGILMASLTDQEIPAERSLDHAGFDIAMSKAYNALNSVRLTIENPAPKDADHAHLDRLKTVFGRCVSDLTDLSLKLTETGHISTRTDINAMLYLCELQKSSRSFSRDTFVNLALHNETIKRYGIGRALAKALKNNELSAKKSENVSSGSVTRSTEGEAINHSPDDCAASGRADANNAIADTNESQPSDLLSRDAKSQVYTPPHRRTLSKNTGNTGDVTFPQPLTSQRGSEGHGGGSPLPKTTGSWRHEPPTSISTKKRSLRARDERMAARETSSPTSNRTTSGSTNRRSSQTSNSGATGRVTWRRSDTEPTLAAEEVTTTSTTADAIATKVSGLYQPPDGGKAWADFDDEDDEPFNPEDIVWKN